MKIKKRDEEKAEDEITAADETEGEGIVVIQRMVAEYGAYGVEKRSEIRMKVKERIIWVLYFIESLPDPAAYTKGLGLLNTW